MISDKNKSYGISILILVVVGIIFWVFLSEINKKGKIGNAILKGDIDRVKELIKKGENLEERDYKGQTPLYFAVKAKIDFLKILVAAGANLNAKDNGMNTPLHEACLENNLENVMFLVRSGADINAKNDTLETPLHLSSSRNFDISEFLVKNGADVNARDNRGFTPIFEAIDFNNLKLVELLVENGANVNHKAENLCYPIHRISVKLHESDKDQDEEVKVAEYLIKKGASFNEKDNFGETPLYNAVKGSNIGLVKLFLNLGLNINDENNDQETLIFNANFNNFKLIKYLIDNGADINKKDIKGNTVLHKACDRFEFERDLVIKYLLLKGADKYIDEKNNDGVAPVDIVGTDLKNFFTLYKENQVKAKADAEKEIEDFLNKK